MKKKQLQKIDKLVLLILIFMLFFISTAKSQSINPFSDHNKDGLSDDYPHQTLFYHDNIFSSPKDTGDIIHSITNPSTYCQGLTWDGNYLWCSEILMGKLHQLDPLDGTVIKTIDAPGIHVEGITWDGTSLWALNNNGGPYESNTLYEINPDDGAVISSFEIEGAVWIHGIAWDGQFIWMNDFDTNEIYKVDPASGNIIKHINAPSSDCIGLTWDGAHLWASDFVTQKLYCIDPSDGTTLYEVNCPLGNLRDLAWDGNYLWVIERNSAMIYQVDIGYVASIDDSELWTDHNKLLSIYPNPVFNRTNIEFYLNAESKVSIEIFNQQGILVKSIVNNNFLSGKHIIEWDIKSQNNHPLTNGIYYCILKNGSIITSKIFIVLR